MFVIKHINKVVIFLFISLAACSPVVKEATDLPSSVLPTNSTTDSPDTSISSASSTPTKIVTIAPLPTSTSLPPTDIIETDQQVQYPNCLENMIAFVSDREGNSEIFLMCSDGTAQINISNHPALDTNPLWSPDGKKLAFISRRDDPGFQSCGFSCMRSLYIYDLENNQLEFIADQVGNYFSWAPDGLRLAYQHVYSHETESGYQDIFIVNADGTNARNLTNHSSNNFNPMWSPSGDSILFLSDRNYVTFVDSFETTLYVVDPDGLNLRALVDVLSAEFSWSPDGQQVVFSSNREKPATDVYVINMDGSDLQNLSNTQRYESDPTWSPDGKLIVFAYGCESEQGCELRLVNTDDWTSTTIWTTQGDILSLDISWSPNSQKIFFVDEVNGMQDIFYLDIVTLETGNLTNAPGNDYFPVMQP